MPVLEGFSRVNYYVGPFGNGSKMKFAANLLVAIHNVAAAEAMVLAMKSGLDPALSFKVLDRRRRQLAHVSGPRTDDGQGRLLVGRDDEAGGVAEGYERRSRTSRKRTAVRRRCSAATAPLYIAATANDPLEDTGAVCAVIEKLANYRRKRR